MRITRILLTIIVLATLTAALLPDEAGAVPAFARRYKLSCTTCHAPFPRLKDFGEEFAGNGFIIPEEEKDRDYVSAGDDLLHLNRDFPLGVRFDAWTFFEEGSEVSSDLKAPWGLKLLSGGALARNIGYYFYFYMDERGEVAGVEDAYIHFNNIGGRPFDIMVGQFQTSDPLMKRELRLTFEDYSIYKLNVGESANNLAYDRGVMLTYDIESTGTGLVGFVVNGNGKPDADANRHYDRDKYKNFGLRVSQDVAEPLRVGYYFYDGQEAMDLGAGMFKNSIRYHGPDLTLGNGMFDLNLQYLVRTDSNPIFSAAGEEVETDGIVAELVVAPRRDRSRHYFTLLYNSIDSEISDLVYTDTSAVAYNPYPQDYRTYTVSGTYLLARNLRATVEYTYDAETELSRGGIGLTAGF